MYLHPYKGQFLIIDDPKKTMIFYPLKDKYLGISRFPLKNFLSVKNDYRNQDDTVRNNL